MIFKYYILTCSTHEVHYLDRMCCWVWPQNLGNGYNDDEAYKIMAFAQIDNKNTLLLVV